MSCAGAVRQLREIGSCSFDLVEDRALLGQQLRRNCLDAANHGFAVVEVRGDGEISGPGQPVRLLLHVIAEPERIVHQHDAGPRAGSIADRNGLDEVGRAESVTVNGCGIANGDHWHERNRTRG